MTPENEHIKLIIGYLQGTLASDENNRFYSWINESENNKKEFFEVKAMFDAA